METRTAAREVTDISELAERLDARLTRADAALARDYPGERAGRQPVHTVYVPADRLTPGTTRDWAREARAALDEFGATASLFAAATGIPDDVMEQVHPLVQRKLEADDAVEDLRVDLEDGYGVRPDDEEDDAAVAAARALAGAVREGAAPPFFGLRFKSFEAPTRRRGLRSLDLFLGELSDQAAIGRGLRLTLPKVTSVDQVRAMVETCEWLEAAHRLDPGSLTFEIQVETPQAVLGRDGTALVAPMVHASQGRCSGLHYGTYDYSASCGIAAAYQSMEHPAADHAKAVMQVAAAGTGVQLSDGSTNVLPVGDRDTVHAAWRLHARLVRRSLERGFYQGWDMHPAQLPSRYAATYAFFRTGLGSALDRLSAYVGKRSTQYLDEPATALALAGFVLRGLDCGAVQVAELTSAGIDPAGLARLARRDGGDR